MSTRRKGQLAAVAMIALVLLLLQALQNSTQPPIASAVTISFLGYTNFPSNNWRYARFAISNQAAYDVRFHGFLSEVEGNGNKLAPTVDPRMSECHFATILKGRSAITNAIGQPPDEPASAPWRFDTAVSQYTMSERWFDVVWRHPWLQQIGAMRLINPQRTLDPTNHTPVSDLAETMRRGESSIRVIAVLWDTPATSIE